MSGRNPRLSQGNANARAIRHAIGNEIRGARLSAGISQRTAGAAVKMSHSEFGRIERGELLELGVNQLSRACAAVGLRLVVRAYPDADPVVDRAQLGLLGRFRERLPPKTRWLTEVPLEISGDRRAWDAVVGLPSGRFIVEAETRLRDIQALERRIALKIRDGGDPVAVLLVSDTAANRRALAVHGDLLRQRFPLNGRAILRAIDGGRCPEANGILVL